MENNQVNYENPQIFAILIAIFIKQQHETTMTFYDIVGTGGVVIILYTYAMLHLDKMSAKSLSYSILNLMGSFMILYSLFYQWNLASVIIEVAWIIISLYGLYKYFSIKKSSPK